jgi:hypothetical protein
MRCQKSPLEIECDRLVSLLTREPGLTVTVLLRERNVSAQALVTCHQQNRVEIRVNGSGLLLFPTFRRRAAA